MYTLLCVQANLKRYYILQQFVFVQACIYDWHLKLLWILWLGPYNTTNYQYVLLRLRGFQEKDNLKFYEQ